MKFGLALTQFTDRFEHLAADARLAEEVGLDAVWLADHLYGGGAEGPIFEAWTALSYVAGITDRVRLGHLVNCVAYRNVGVLAKMVTTVDHASAGRLDLGLGAGWHQGEYEAFGWDFPSPAQRVRYFEAYAGVLLRLLDGEVVDHDGEGVVVREAQVVPGPVQQPHPPVVIGTGGRRMLELTGRLADVWNCPARLLDRLEEPRAVADAAAAAAGRTLRTSIQVPVVVARTDAELAAAMEVATTHLAWMGDIEGNGIVGTVAQAAERAAAYRDRGVDEVVGVMPGSRARPAYVEAYGEMAASLR